MKIQFYLKMNTIFNEYEFNWSWKHQKHNTSLKLEILLFDERFASDCHQIRTSINPCQTYNLARDC